MTLVLLHYIFFAVECFCDYVFDLLLYIIDWHGCHCHRHCWNNTQVSQWVSSIVYVDVNDDNLFLEFRCSWSSWNNSMGMERIRLQRLLMFWLKIEAQGCSFHSFECWPHCIVSSSTCDLQSKQSKYGVHRLRFSTQWRHVRSAQSWHSTCERFYLTKVALHSFNTLNELRTRIRFRLELACGAGLQHPHLGRQWMREEFTSSSSRWTLASLLRFTCIIKITFHIHFCYFCFQH